ncbi:hypothetical protein LX32DRAFT_253013 [Colletotrichum zoysiae]|uniref:Uncharacterized protein n=1 Tax=Colletotrichum zoysiae TaxID=1216348 RepID=A0AAD9HV45_9PEZI|nr:hypothetical protein LX32DRAFT_253013 [Colletotrichum zoysiae]
MSFRSLPSRMAFVFRTRCGVRPIGVPYVWPVSKPESCGTQSATSPIRPLTGLLRAAFLSERQPAPTNTSASCRPSRQIVWTTATTSASPAVGCVSSIVIICNDWRACRNAYDNRATTVCHHAYPSGIPASGAAAGGVPTDFSREKRPMPAATRDV